MYDCQFRIERTRLTLALKHGPVSVMLKALMLQSAADCVSFVRPVAVCNFSPNFLCLSGSLLFFYFMRCTTNGQYNYKI